MSGHSGWVMMVCLVVVVVVSAVSPVVAESCRYRYYPINEGFDPDDLILPNSVCIYPDGRTALSDATSGGIEIVVYWLQYFNDQATWVGTEFDPYFVTPLGVELCGGAVVFQADMSTGPPVLFSEQPVYGGGHSPVGSDGYPTAPVYYVWAPSECGTVPMQIYFNSPDINGDLTVDMADAGLFSQDFSAGYNYRSDFNFDGVINMADAGMLSAATGANCQ